MALIPCPECARQVSDQAASCPSCGHPVAPPAATPSPPRPPAHRTGVLTPPKKGNSGCAVVALGLLSAFAVVTCISTISHPKSSLSPVPSAATAMSARSPAQLLEDVRNTDRAAAARLSSAEQLVREHPDTEEGRSAAAMVATLREEVRRENLGKQWVYTSFEDSMTGKTAHQAAVRSTNTHEFEFPYHRPQKATLSLRDHPRYGKDVIFQIERGQLQCSSYSGCTVMVRFGDAEPRRYNATGPEDNSSEVLFFNNSADFRRRMQAVERVRISTSIYQEGSPAWEFDVSGFKPERMM